MENLIFDTHAHFDDEAFDKNRDELIKQMQNGGVCNIINCATCFKDFSTTLNLANKYDFIYAALGLQPEYLKETPSDKSWVLNLEKSILNNKKVKAIGEIGLDYHYKESASKETQIYYFKEQIKLAKKLDLPVIIHSRDAIYDTLDIIKKYKPKGVVHCFSGSKEVALELVKLGVFIGIGGVLTFKNAKNILSVAKSINLKNILLETDSPYMSPEPVRGTINNSLNIKYVAKKLAQIKNETEENILKITKQNAINLFNIKD